MPVIDYKSFYDSHSGKFREFFQKSRAAMLERSFAYPDSVKMLAELAREFDALVIAALAPLADPKTGKEDKITPADKAEIMRILSEAYGGLHAIQFLDRAEAQAYRASVSLLAGTSETQENNSHRRDVMALAAQSDAVLIENFLRLSTNVYSEITPTLKRKEREDLHLPPAKYFRSAASNPGEFLLRVVEKEVGVTFDRAQQLKIDNPALGSEVDKIINELERGASVSNTPTLNKALDDIQMSAFDSVSPHDVEPVFVDRSESAVRNYTRNLAEISLSQGDSSFEDQKNSVINAARMHYQEPGKSGNHQIHRVIDDEFYRFALEKRNAIVEVSRLDNPELIGPVQTYVVSKYKLKDNKVEYESASIKVAMPANEKMHIKDAVAALIVSQVTEAGFSKFPGAEKSTAPRLPLEIQNNLQAAYIQAQPELNSYAKKREDAEAILFAKQKEIASIAVVGSTNNQSKNDFQDAMDALGKLKASLEYRKAVYEMRVNTEQNYKHTLSGIFPTSYTAGQKLAATTKIIDSIDRAISSNDIKSIKNDQFGRAAETAELGKLTERLRSIVAGAPEHRSIMDETGPDF